MRAAFLALVGGLLVYEFVALRNECDGDTISEIVWTATTERPIVPFAAGVVCGHFFWQRRGMEQRRPLRAFA
jgi:hypothetical protein